MELNAIMVRYIVNDVDAAIAFYSKHLGFRVTAQSGPFFAILTRATRSYLKRRLNSLSGIVAYLDCPLFTSMKSMTASAMNSTHPKRPLCIEADSTLV